MKKIDVEELKQIQMEILDYVDAFCQKHNIKYSLSGGSLIGAIRHQGFIPWDDDIDIQLLRDDYNRLVTEWNKHSHPYVFHNIESKTNRGTAFGKISNPKTVLKDGPCVNMGVNIDVYPIDKVVDQEDFLKRHNAILNLYVIHWRINRNWSWKPNIIFWKIWGKFFSPAYYENKINNIAKEKQDKDSNLVFELIAGRGYKNPWHVDAFNETISVQFENRQYQAMKGYHEYLTQTFGDYMQLPPKEKQITHHQFEAWWKE